jgi:hypothetical protein
MRPSIIAVALFALTAAVAAQVAWPVATGAKGGDGPSHASARGKSGSHRSGRTGPGKPTATPTPPFRTITPSRSSRPPCTKPGADNGDPKPCRPTSTHTPFPPLVSLAVDCDVTTAGVQSHCAAPVGEPLEVGVVLANVSGRDLLIGAADFLLDYGDGSLLPPSPTDGSAFDGNPDFNDALFGPTWDCLPLPTPHWVNGSNGDSGALLSCFVTQHGTMLELAAGEEAVFGTVHFDAPSGYGEQALEFVFAHISDDLFDTLGSCTDPGGSFRPMPCAGATVGVYLEAFSGCIDFEEPPVCPTQPASTTSQ